MFRRRPMRPPGRPPFFDRTPPALKRAFHMLEQQRYDEAAQDFEMLAARAEERDGPRAPQFLLQAGRARVLAGQPDAGVVHIRRALEMIVQTPRARHAEPLGRQAVESLRAHGFDAQAQDLEMFLGTLAAGRGALGQTTPQSESSASIALPTHCPSCGGPVRSDEVEWIDALTAECVFCGSPIRAVQK